MNGHFEWHAMEIARLWGREPDWYFELDERDQARLFAWYRLKISGDPYRDPKKKLHAREAPVNVVVK